MTIDTNSSTWSAVIEWCEKEREELMFSNNNANNNHIVTTFIRGQIQALERVMDIPGGPGKTFLTKKGAE